MHLHNSATNEIQILAIIRTTLKKSKMMPKLILVLSCKISSIQLVFLFKCHQFWRKNSFKVCVFFYQFLRDLRLKLESSICFLCWQCWRSAISAVKQRGQETSLFVAGVKQRPEKSPVLPHFNGFASFGAKNCSVWVLVAVYKQGNGEMPAFQWRT